MPTVFHSVYPPQCWKQYLSWSSQI